MNQSRAGHTATLLDDGRVLIAGGRGDKSSELYDPESHKFVAGPEMVAARVRAFGNPVAGRNRADRGRMGS